MNERIKNQYNSLYTSEKNVFGGGRPVEVVQNLNRYLTGGSVLDLGGGEGRNALYLAEQGFSVSVYDISDSGIERLKASAKERELNIDTQVVDVTNKEIEGLFDSIVITFILHHMGVRDAKILLTKAQKHTAKKGFHILSTFINQGGLYDRNQGSGRFYPSEKTVRELYSDWDIKELSVNEITTHARDKSGERMKNHVLSLIAMNTK